MTDPVQRPTCAVKGSLHGGRAMCSRVINAEFCGNSEPCEHKIEQAPEARVQCNQCMWVGDEDDLLWIGEDYIRHCPACNANDETLMDLLQDSTV